MLTRTSVAGPPTKRNAVSRRLVRCLRGWRSVGAERADAAPPSRLGGAVTAVSGALPVGGRAALLAA